MLKLAPGAAFTTFDGVGSTIQEPHLGSQTGIVGDVTNILG